MRAPLLEREAELSRLVDAARAAGAGHGAVVLVEGDAGIGKSRLLEELRSRAGDLLALSSRGVPLEAAFPFGAALQLLGATVARAEAHARAALLADVAAPARELLSGSMPPAVAGGADDRLYSIVHGLFWLVSNLAERRPLLLCVDDADWTDAPTLRLLAYLAERIEDLPVCLVVAGRRDAQGPAGELLDAIRRSPTAAVLRPAPLSPGAVEVFVRLRRPAADGAFCAACAEVTGGNPLLFVELLEEIERRGVAADGAAVPRLEDLVPERLADAVAARLARLAPPAQALARAGAVLGEDAELRHAAAVAQLAPEDAAAAADVLAEAGLMVAGDRLRFVNALVAAAVGERLRPGEAGNLHRRAARVMYDAGANPERVAVHLAAAPPGGEAWAASTLMVAADRALREGAPGPAAVWLRRAADEAPDRAGRAEALAALGRAELALGEHDGIRRLSDAAALEQRPQVRAGLLLELGRAQTSAGALEEAAATLERALAFDAGDPSLRAEIEAAWVTVARHVGRLQERARERTRELLARPRPTTHGERVLLAAAANQSAFAGDPHDRVLALARRALDGGRLLAEETPAGLSWAIALAALGWADDFQGVERTARSALADARARGSIAGFAMASYARAYASLHAGAVADAAADSRQAIDAHPDPHWTLRPFACVQLAWAELERDDPDAAVAAIEMCRPDERWMGAPAYMLVLEARGRIALARGRAAEALELLLESGRQATAAEIANPVVVPWRSGAVLASVQAGDRRRAATLAAEELALAGRFGTPRARAAALRSTALAERGSRSVELLEEAVAVLSGSPAVLERVRALVELGSAQRRAGRSAVARERLREGLALARGCGASALARRAEAELEAAGARPRRRALRGPGALTPGELRVARMAAAGMTNREIAQALFVTVKAVQYHLSNAYRKLEVPGREALAAALSE